MSDEEAAIQLLDFNLNLLVFYTNLIKPLSIDTDSRNTKKRNFDSVVFDFLKNYFTVLSY